MFSFALFDVSSTPKFKINCFLNRISIFYFELNLFQTKSNRKPNIQRKAAQPSLEEYSLYALIKVPRQGSFKKWE
jgi:hypothetical protein